MNESIHAFEKAGLGKAPFACVGVYDRGRLNWTSCNFCGASIRYEYIIHDADDRAFVVGSECVAKTGDMGLIDSMRAAKKAHRAEARAARAEARAEERRVANESRATEITVRAEEFIATFGIAAAVTVDHPIIKDIAARLYRFGSLSGAQVDLIKRLAVESRVVKSPVVEGQGISIEGVIASTKSDEGNYGRSTLKMRVRDDRGFTVWGTVPDSILGRPLAGLRVRFVANVEASRDDTTFGFFKRPRKAVLIDVESPTRARIQVNNDVWEIVVPDGDVWKKIAVHSTRGAAEDHCVELGLEIEP